MAVLLVTTAIAQVPAKALKHALNGTRSSAVVIDWKTGQILAANGPARQDSPGSAIKPLLLNYALKAGIVRSMTTVYCRRDLHVGSRALPCTHPPDRTTFDAETALAESCNTWFAAMARRFPPQQLEDALERTGLRHVSMQHATVEERELAVLGLNGVSVTPIAMARAYREMLQHGPYDAVMRGLRGSVEYGMANNARVAHVNVLGKTGTAANAQTARTHGWFAGAVPGRFVVVVYVPDGNGAEAAALAGKFIAATVAGSAVQ